MPRIKPKEEDDSYDGPAPQSYRKYSQNTKKKLWRLVNQEGKKASSAAKLLKVKNSTAKMILKTFKDKEQQKEEVISKLASEKQLNLNKNDLNIQKQINTKQEISGEPMNDIILVPLPFLYYYFNSPNQNI